MAARTPPSPAGRGSPRTGVDFPCRGGRAASAVHAARPPASSGNATVENRQIETLPGQAARAGGPRWIVPSPAIERHALLVGRLPSVASVANLTPSLCASMDRTTTDHTAAPPRPLRFVPPVYSVVRVCTWWPFGDSRTPTPGSGETRNAPPISDANRSRPPSRRAANRPAAAGRRPSARSGALPCRHDLP